MTHNSEQLPQPVRHLGIFRTGVTTAQAALDNRILGLLFRRGTQTSALVANYLKVEPESLKARLTQLAEWDMVELKTTTQTGSFRVTLTKNGEFWAMESISKEGEAVK